MTIHTIREQLELVTELKERFDNAIELQNCKEAEKNLKLYLDESAKLDKMEDQL